MGKMMVVGYRGINRYLVECSGGWLLVDAGWAGTLAQLKQELGRMGIEPREIRYVMMTHNHPDHGGLTQEVKRACGARLLIHEVQIPLLDELRAFHDRRGERYERIVVEPGDVVVKRGSGLEALKPLGIVGQLVETPGHTDDSVSLVTAEGLAFTGDLHLPTSVPEGALAVVSDSWRRLLSLGARTAYPGHGGPVDMGMVEGMLGR